MASTTDIKTRLLGALVAALVFSAVYLYAFPAPTIAYAGIVLLHVVLGVAALVVIAFLLIRGVTPPTRSARLGWGLFSVAGTVGVGLIFLGTARPQWKWLYLHVILSLAAVVVLAAHWASRRGWLAAVRGGAVLRLAGFAVVVGALSWAAYENREG